MVTTAISYIDCVPYMSFGNNIKHAKQAQRIPAVWQSDILLMA